MSIYKSFHPGFVIGVGAQNLTVSDYALFKSNSYKYGLYATWSCVF